MLTANVSDFTAYIGGYAVSLPSVATPKMPFATLRAISHSLKRYKEFAAKEKGLHHYRMKNIQSYNAALSEADQKICNLLMKVINQNLKGTESKIWHGHPVWFIEGNPIVGYSKQKLGIRLMFWSGQGFGEEKLKVKGGKFKDASIFYNDVGEVNLKDLERWLGKAAKIQWDYKNIVKRRGVLKKLK